MPKTRPSISVGTSRWMTVAACAGIVIDREPAPKADVEYGPVCAGCGDEWAADSLTDGLCQYCLPAAASSSETD